ncbi:ABC transporter permease [Halobellus ruber]|uniref:ABC transporter permease subunit n=1 Tax=Halobellus ruber TaxID=2761102 RepID=A0A7J9SHN3_9EURY|nr:ABC transporter permease subunit [Halobellus ruber]MBB6645649.1 ABC transporter permease subunit [Halobellus ruber]
MSNKQSVQTGDVPERDPDRIGRLSAAFGRRAVTGLIAVTVVFLIAPVFFTVIASFASEWTGVIPTGFFTFQNWAHVLGLTDTVGAQRALGSFSFRAFGYTVTVPFLSLFFSVVLALGGVVINLIVGVPVAYAVTRYDFYGRGWVNTFAVLPIVPGVILGIAFLRTYPDLPSALALVIGYSLLKAPYMVLAVQSSFEGMDLRQLEESARSLGASWPRTFFTVIIPNAKTGIIAGSIICWTLAAAEFNFTYMVYSRGPRPFSIFLYNNITNSPILQTAAAVSIYFIIVAGVTALLRRTGQSGFSVGGAK